MESFITETACQVFIERMSEISVLAFQFAVNRKRGTFRSRKLFYFTIAARLLTTKVIAWKCKNFQSLITIIKLLSNRQVP